MPNYTEMSLIELKHIASQLPKERRIKQYYIKSKEELISLLSMPELPHSLRLAKKTLVELRQEAKEREIRGIWKLSRDELLDLLYPSEQTSSHKDEKNQRDAHKHNDPQEHDPQQVGVEEIENGGNDRAYEVDF